VAVVVALEYERVPATPAPEASLTTNWMDEEATSWLNVALMGDVTATPVAPGPGIEEVTLGAGGALAVVKLHE
jgi:hypothetical protein